MSSFGEVALRLPDGRLVPAWNGNDAREMNARWFDGWGEIVIEAMRVDMIP